MPFEIIDGMSMADAAFIARGKDLAELFVSGARALLSIMLHDPESVMARESLRIDLDRGDLDILYYGFLQEFLFYKDARGLLLVPVRVEVREKDGSWSCSCEAAGEAIDRTRHVFATDVKAVTLHGLEVRREGEVWTARTVVDV